MFDICLMVLFLLPSTIISTPTTTTTNTFEQNLTRYLIRYGYIDDSLNENNLQSFDGGKSFFQDINSVGTDKEIAELMNRPRCGNRDIDNDFTVRFQNLSWPMLSLTWDIYPPTQFNIKAVHKATQVWSKYSNLRFRRDQHYTPNIMISFAYSDQHDMYFGDENCSLAFDTLTLAHCYHPNGESGYVVEMHINGKFDWEHNKRYDLSWVILHELGHGLGIQHSTVEGSLMYPWYSHNVKDLQTDDILAVQSLYGIPSRYRTETIPKHIRKNDYSNNNITTNPKTTSTPITTTSKSTQPISGSNTVEELSLEAADICQKKVSEMKFLIVKTSIYIFHKKHLWIFDLVSKKFTTEAIAIRAFLRFLPEFNEITAIYSRPRNEEFVAVIGNNIFIIGHPPTFELKQKYGLSYFDAHVGKKIIGLLALETKSYVIYEGGYLMGIDEYSFTTKGVEYVHTVFPGIPSIIDNVFKYMDGNIYFFAGNRYYTFNPVLRTIVASGDTSLKLFGIECASISVFTQLNVLLQKVLNIYNN